MEHNEVNPVESLISSIKSIEISVNSKIPEMDHAIQALTTIITELEARITQQESIIAVLLSESSVYRKLKTSSSDDSLNTPPLAERRTRGKLQF
jgi:hypothetical protein